MPIQPHPDLDGLISRMQGMKDALRHFTGETCRSATPTYAANRDQLSGEGSRRHGGRWNPPGIRAVYSSTTPETAMAETLANARYYGLPVVNALPRVFVGLRFKLRKVIDLTDGGNRRRLRVSEERMIDTDWHLAAGEERQPLTQAIGQAAHHVGVEAMLVPSAADRPGGVNLIVFPDNLLGSSLARVITGIG